MSKPVKAAICDFKTDQSPVDLRQRYKVRLDARGGAVAVLPGMAPDQFAAVPLRSRVVPF